MAGTPNRRTVEVQARLDELGCDPIEGMARIALDITNPPELRGRMFAELAQYVAPKRKAIDLNSGRDDKVIFNLGIARRQPQQQVADSPMEGVADQRGHDQIEERPACSEAQP